MIARNQIREALQAVQDPELKRSIVDLGMVREILVKDDEVQINLALTTLGCPMKKRIVEVFEAIAQAVSNRSGAARERDNTPSDN